MDHPPDDQGGDPACWLDQVCDHCGQVIETDPHLCPADQTKPANR